MTRSTVQSTSDSKPITSATTRSLLSPAPAAQAAQSPSSTILSAMRQAASPSLAPVTVTKPPAAARASSDTESSSSDDDDDTPAPAPVSRRAATVGITVRTVSRPAPNTAPAPVAAQAETKPSAPTNDKPATNTGASLAASMTAHPPTPAAAAPNSKLAPATMSSTASAATGKQQPVADKKPPGLLPAPLPRPSFTPASSSLASLRGLPPAVAASARHTVAAASAPASRAPAFGGRTRELSDDELSIEANDDEGADLDLDFDDDEEKF